MTTTGTRYLPLRRPRVMDLDIGGWRQSIALSQLQIWLVRMAKHMQKWRQLCKLRDHPFINGIFIKYSKIHEYSLNIYKFINEKWLLWWNRAKNHQFLEMHISQKMFTKKLIFSWKKCPEKNSKGVWGIRGRTNYIIERWKRTLP